MCNHYKGPNIAAADPATGDPTFLYHPRRDAWDDHFVLDGAVIEPQTPEGRATSLCCISTISRALNSVKC